MFNDIIKQSSVPNMDTNPFEINSIQELSNFITEASFKIEKEPKNSLSFIERTKKFISKVINFFVNLVRRIKTFVYNIFNKNKEFKKEVEKEFKDNVYHIHFKDENRAKLNQTKGNKVKVIDLNKLKDLKMVTYNYNPDLFEFDEGMLYIFRDIDKVMHYKLKDFIDGNMSYEDVNNLNLDYWSIYANYIKILIHYKDNGLITVDEIKKYIDKKMHGDYKKVEIGFNLQELTKMIDDCEYKIAYTMHNLDILLRKIREFSDQIYRTLDYLKNNSENAEGPFFQTYVNAIRYRITAFIEAISYLCKVKVDLLTKQIYEYSSFINYAKEVAKGNVKDTSFKNVFNPVFEDKV